MEQHRANAVCASCHAAMDPLGFAFENFDAIGAWRDKDGDVPDRPLRRAARRPVVPGAGRAEERSCKRQEGVVRPLPGREDADLRPGPGAGVLRPAAPSTRSCDALEKDDYRFSTLLAGGRQERPVPDANRDGRTEP